MLTSKIRNYDNALMPNSRSLLLALVPLTAALLAPGAARAVDAPADGPAVIVLDGSGSMWGNVGAEKPAKFDLARAALRQELSTLSPRVKLGLMSFGHRRRADCSDVEVLAAPEAGPPERILALADRLSPKGKGPLALTLREAAKQIPAGEAGSIIVLHDGVDNCWQDPCAAAADIAKANGNVRIFLVSFGLERGEAQRLQCVAEATNGRVVEAQDSTSLADAISNVLMLANLERADAVPAAQAPQAAAPPAPAGAPGVQLSISLSDGGPPLAAPVAWSLFKAADPATPLKTLRSKEFSADLDPGSYVVEARFGQASVRKTIEVSSSGPTAQQLSLDAGYLKLNALSDKNGAALADPLISVVAQDGPSAGVPRWIGRDAAAKLVVPAGAYRVTIRDGLAQQVADVTVAAGATADVAPVLGTGRLELSALTAATGEPLSEVVYVIEEDDPDAPQGRREVIRSAAATAAFTLPAGTYYLIARAGVGEVHERIALGSGDVVKHVARFNLVPITISAVAADGSVATSTASHPLMIRVLTEDANAREVARAYGASGTFQLPPARYRVEASISGLNIVARGIIDLLSGRGGRTQLKLEQGEISVSGPTGAYWRIKDASGRTVMHSGPGRPSRERLAPGRYILLTEADGTSAERAIDLKAGEQQAVSVTGTP